MNAETAHDPPEGHGVMPPGLVREAKQGEKQECREHIHPLTHDDRDQKRLVVSPDNRRHHLDVVELCVRVCPGDPGRQVHACRVDVDAVCADRNRANHLRERQEHESEVAADGHPSSVRGHDLAKLDSMPKEAEKRQDCRCHQYDIDCMMIRNLQA